MIKAGINVHFLLICIHFFSVHARGSEENIAPVILWSELALAGHVNPLQEISKPQFTKILEEQFDKVKPPIMVFVIKENFCIEDIIQHQQSIQKLNNSGSFSYLTSVEAPMTVFGSLSSYNITAASDIESFLHTFDQFAEGQLIFVEADLDSISHSYDFVKGSSPSTVFAVTGKYCRFLTSERNKRSIDPLTETSNLSFREKNIIFFADGYPVIKFDKNKYSIMKKFLSKHVSTDDKHYFLTMNFTDEANRSIMLKAQFDVLNGYYSLAGFEYARGTEDVKFLKAGDDIIFPFNFSYHCHRESVFSHQSKDNDIVLQLTNMQVQMDSENFDAAYDCIGFMSASIWTGLFVITILAVIFIWGLVLILDIRTMDHFDDPKGKTITIATQD